MPFCAPGRVVLMDKIILKGMEFYGFHGVEQQEKRQSQKFLVDVEIGFSTRKAGESDLLEDTIDYGAVFRDVRQIMEEETSVSLLETLAEKIATLILTRYPAEEVLVRVKKPAALLPGKFRWVGVETFREKEKEK